LRMVAVLGRVGGVFGGKATVCGICSRVHAKRE
jgi:hypothetical protein